MAYEDTYIYVFLFPKDYVFQYLFVYNGELYENHIMGIRPPLWRRIAYKIKLLKLQDLYEREMLEQGEQVLLSGAMKSIDALKELANLKPIPNEK